MADAPNDGSPASSFAQLDRGQRKKLKKQLEKGRASKSQLLAYYGEHATAAIELLPAADARAASAAARPPPPLPLLEVQNVLLWSLADDLGELPKWIGVRHKPLIRGCLLAAAPSLAHDGLSEEGGRTAKKEGAHT